MVKGIYWVNIGFYTHLYYVKISLLLYQTYVYDYIICIIRFRVENLNVRTKIEPLIKDCFVYQPYKITNDCNTNYYEIINDFSEL